MKHWLVVDRTVDWPTPLPGVEVITAEDFLSNPPSHDGERVRVYNLCRSLRYQSNGYHVSLLAGARGFSVVPDVATVQDLKSPTLARMISDDEAELIQRSLKTLHGQDFILSIYFGQGLAKRHEELARTLYNRSPTPLLRARFQKRDEHWELERLQALALEDVPEEHLQSLHEAAAQWFGKRRRAVAPPKPLPFDLAILVNPEDNCPPSDERALRLFEAAGERAGFSVDRIGHEDFGDLTEYDALFIRETTFVNHHTYRFARRAALEGMVVIDDPDSILRCTNKVYLAERLARAGIPMPETRIVTRGNLQELGAALGFPLVLKQPDSAFSRGVVKASNEEELKLEASRLLKSSDLLVAQAFQPTDFDWRVGVFAGKALYVCRYFMAPKHWQIIQHASDGNSMTEGKSETLPVEEAPKDLIRTAVRAANAMGDGLYGVDIKQVGNRYLVIEVNDNPSIEAGVEDAVIGKLLYQTIMDEMRRRVELSKRD